MQSAVLPALLVWALVCSFQATIYCQYIYLSSTRRAIFAIPSPTPSATTDLFNGTPYCCLQPTDTQTDEANQSQWLGYTLSTSSPLSSTHLVHGLPITSSFMSFMTPHTLARSSLERLRSMDSARMQATLYATVFPPESTLY